MDQSLSTTKYYLLSEEVKKEINDFVLNEYDSLVYVGMLIYNTTYQCIGIIDDIFKEGENIMIAYTLEDVWGEKKSKKENIKEYFNFRNNIPLNSSKEEFEKDIDYLINNKNTNEALKELVEQKFGKTNSNSTEIMLVNKNIVVDKRNELLLKRDYIMSRYKNMEAILDAKKRELYNFVDDLKEQIIKINKVIIQIELYLGIEETIEQIQVGLSAPENEPISLRQRILYMDVECGDPTNDGLDFSTIEKFDEWLLSVNSYWKKKNYELLIPEKKCIVIFKVRRDDKHYSENPFIQTMMNEGNKKTYIFLRNGENIYKIWSELINIHGQVFPTKSEFEKLMLKLQSESSYDKKSADNTVHSYKLGFMMFQGIFERTQIFQNSNSIKLFDSSIDNSDKLKYIYDDDNSTQLPTNIPVFCQWRNKLNNSIEEGSRIYYIESLFDKHTSFHKYREESIRERIFKQWFVNDYAYPDNGPKDGIYTVYKETDKKFAPAQGTLYIKYTPKKRFSNYNDEARTKGFSFKIEKHEEWFINYDAIGHEELKTLEFYMYTRIGREDYLFYIPMLMQIYKSRKEELALEKEFIKLVISVNKLEDTTETNNEILRLIDWWKLKNKWKRALDVDNTKALRMISKELKKI